MRRLALALLLLVLAVPAARAESNPTVLGAGSTWSAVAVQQWAADINRQGIKINYQAVGSSAGRQFYIQKNADFAVSEIPFQPEEKGSVDQAGRPYVYLPIVAGGTSFMYNLRDTSGKAITSLRLTAKSIGGIFTGRIKKWNDAAISGDNPGLSLPDQTITPVTRSDGSGTSAQFTAYLTNQNADDWCPFAKSHGIDPCAFTSNYPPFTGSVQQSGSDGVANYVHNEKTGVGAITYVESAYALQRGRPVAYVRNASGNFTQPISRNVAVALTKATLNADRTQNLGQVYTNPDPATYPVSSYSYMIAPTTGFDQSKGRVMGTFMNYFACEGQRKADLLGYSPLPPNLVEVVFEAVRQVPGAPAPPAMKDCANPTIQQPNASGTNANPNAASFTGGNASGSMPAGAPAPASSRPGATTGGSRTSNSTAGTTNTTLSVDAAESATSNSTDDTDPSALSGEESLDIEASALQPVNVPAGASSTSLFVALAFLLAVAAFGPALFAMLWARRPGLLRSAEAEAEA